MLFFLRQIRRKLMNENKFTTYLLYAVGEIVLVVVGILIAVQIDTWSDSRKDEDKVKKHIEALKKELAGNLLVLKEDLAYSQEKLDTIAVLQKIMTKEGSDIETLISLARYHFDFAYDSDVHLNNITFQTLESTGEIGLLDQALRDSLYNYQAELKKSSNIIKYNYDFYAELDKEYHAIYPPSGEDYFLQGELANEVWESIDKKDFLLRFNALVSNKLLTEIHAKLWKSMLVAETQSFLSFINEKYP